MPPRRVRKWMRLRACGPTSKARSRRARAASTPTPRTTPPEFARCWASAAGRRSSAAGARDDASRPRADRPIRRPLHSLRRGGSSCCAKDSKRCSWSAPCWRSCARAATPTRGAGSGPAQARRSRPARRGAARQCALRAGRGGRQSRAAGRRDRPGRRRAPAVRQLLAALEDRAWAPGSAISTSAAARRWRATASLSLAVLAFLAVFREGAETVLFYIGIAPAIELGDLLLGIGAATGCWWCAGC